MKKNLFLSAILLLGLASCGDSDTPPPPILVTSVTLTPTTLQLTVGQNATLTATITPSDAHNQQKTWESSDSNIASVTNGQVTANAHGTATITVVTADGGRTADAIVTVTPIAVIGITLDRNTLELAIDATATLTATVTPTNATNQNVMWSSSDRNIATVDNYGKITTHATGITTITVTTADGEKTATCVVMVYDPYNDIGVEINAVRWATRNVNAPGTFAPTPASSGMFYQWNRRIGWSTTDPMINSNGGTEWDSSIPTGTSWTRENDPCPEGWRVPTREELEYLRNADSEWVIRNGIKGRSFGTDSEQVFLPAAGWRLTLDGFLLSVADGGFYWGSECSGDMAASILEFNNNYVSVSWNMRTLGISVRCVAK